MTEHDNENKHEHTPAVLPDFITACATIFQERRDTNPEPSPKALALGEVLSASFAGVAPDDASVQTLREGTSRTPAAEPWTRALTEQVQPRTKHSPKSGLQAKRAGWVRERQRQCDVVHRELPLMESFDLPADPAAQEAYVDALISRGVPEHEVWLQTRRHYVVNGGM